MNYCFVGDPWRNANRCCEMFTFFVQLTWRWYVLWISRLKTFVALFIRQEPTGTELDSMDIEHQQFMLSFIVYVNVSMGSIFFLSK